LKDHLKKVRFEILKILRPIFDEIEKLEDSINLAEFIDAVTRLYRVRIIDNNIGS
jgi:hypothetical protein